MATLIKSDLDFILQQIFIAEAHAAGADLSTLIPNSFVPFGLRTVDGTLNNVFPGQSEFGAADNLFPRLVDPVFLDDADGDTFGPVTNTDYGAAGHVADADPRLISNLVVDQTIGNPAAVQAFVDAGLGTLDPDGVLLDANGDPIPAGVTLTIPNVTPDEGLSAPFNSWFTFFGQFFDHGLDLVNKGGNGTIFIPLQADDPLFDPTPGAPNFMVLTRATRDPVTGEQTNQTTPFVDQNQTYTSHPSHQVFLREYELNADGEPVATGRMLDGADGGLGTWADVKAQALNMLGIQLDDADVLDLPLLATDQYGKFIPDPDTGFAQIVLQASQVGGPLDPDGNGLASGTAATPIDASLGIRTGHAFLNDIAHAAAPVLVAGVLAPDSDGAIGLSEPGTYDNELLDRHFITGDGRGNENIALTAVHHVFHSEHNRQADEIKATILATDDTDFIASWQLADGSWNGERVFQAARFATEMQYQHLVFEEFARKMQPMVDVFLAPEGFDTTINPAIVAEFAHAVFRVGHSMLNETVDRLDPNFVSNDISLLSAFLNPVAFNNDGTLSPEAAAGAIVRGMTRQQGNEIDEFVTDAVRNTLLGLPLDLPAINIARGRDTGIPTLNAARREFYDMTSDSQLTPYTSWLDLTQHLKHEASVINFIAAYGTHVELLATDVDTLAEKRAVATALVFGGDAIINAGSAEERTFTADELDRLAFLNSTGTYANLANGVTTTGVDAIDLWIGGLAEKQMPFGGLLGSTFNFVFETQMEALQNGDRFYYLARTAGLNFLTELENNSFAKLVMLNTDTTHLPADIFSTPAWILEVDATRQFNDSDGDGLLDNLDPTGGTALTPLVIRDNPTTTGADTNYLQYTGVDHVVLGGTAGNDIIISSIGDDTLWGDAGNDRLEGGDGVDNVEGGAGDDIITDLGGDDVLKGNEGNDVIHGGNGFNLLLGGDGSDFIITGEDVSETFGGQGNDFILGAQMNLPTFGNEGDDWIEIGTSDGAGGDNFDPQEDSTVIGHDVFITGGGFDEADGEGGDDIMVFSDGEDHFGGGGGFDWASYKNDELGVTADLLVNDLIEPPVAPSNQGILDRFADVEGLSGSAFSDILRGDNADAAEIGAAGPLNGALTRIGLIDGLQDLLGAGVTSFDTGNIILGGDGSDIIEGRGGDDLIDGDRSLNVRVSVRSGFDATGPTGAELATFDSLAHPTLLQNMLNGVWNPGQLQIVREILTADGPDFDTAMFSDVLANYSISLNPDGSTTIVHLPDAVTGVATGIDGADRVINIERLQFSPDLTALTPEGVTGRVVLAPGLNNEPVGSLTINDDTPAVNQLLSVSAAGITDADNPGTGAITGGPISFIWQVERDPVNLPSVFEDIVALGASDPATAGGTSFRVTADLDGLALRVRAVYQDADGTLENVFSAPTAAVNGVIALPPVTPVPAETPVNSPGNGVHLIRADLQFILDQIVVAERDAAGEDLLDIISNSRLPFGLRTVDGSFNNLVQGQSDFGAADTLFPRSLDPVFRDADPFPFDPDGPGPLQAGGISSYQQTSGLVFDSQPRIISNLIVDQTANNPAAAGLGAPIVMSPGLDGIFGTADDREVFFIPNVTPDEGLSAPFNSFMTFFGQFFDHGLDLVTKGGNGTMFVPLQPDDPLYVEGSPTNFMVLTRATQFNGPGADGILGDNPDTIGIDESADDTTHEAENTTSPFVDQNQTYTSHSSHQVFLRAYELNGAGDPVATGRLITNRDLGDGIFGNGDDLEIGGMATWAIVKAQARDILGIELDDLDALNLPLLAADAYGNFIRDPLTGFPQIVLQASAVGGALDPDGNGLASGSPGAPIDASLAIRTGHGFLNDIAHSAAPVGDHDGNPSTPNAPLTADADDVAGGTPALGFYDNELLDAHYMAGDGRVNENIALTTVHHVFHAEHNRLVEHTKDVILASNDPTFIAQWQLADGSWNGERLFQAAKFGTEMQYQHLVFEEFARKVQPQVDVFLAEGQGYDSTINPAIVAEFAHTVYRFGHSMLTETVDRYDPDFNVVGDPNSMDPGQQLGLIAAFLNPLEFAAGGPTPDEAAGALVRGLTRQPGNEIDEFVTEALRNNLLGLPLDLPAINLLRGRDTGVPSLNAARREFYDATGDSQLKPYTSWADLVQHLKHELSVVNFIAAYGTHSELTAADVDTLVEKRAVATALVFGGSAVINEGALDERTFIADDDDRIAFLNSTGDYANLANGVTSTGVDAIDLWIGGLAEKQMPFGGLLGSTFNFVFETQLEALQNGDRFYYLERTAGLNFLTELENNSFAKLIMANTDTTHLSGDVFSTPAFTLEVDSALQFTGLGPDGRDDPTEGGTALTPLVIRNNPGTEDPDPNYLQYTGVDHVVLGGTAGNDTLISSIGDDTLYGDGGNDRLEGGDGVDMILGGAGDDIITDLGGDDNLQGQDGNDAIHGGNGINLILGGFGNDFIVTGEDESEAFGGPGNDFIFGVRPVEMLFGNEGDDWIEHGMADGSAGENFDTRGLDSIVGNDVFMGDTVSDRMGGEGGDDIMFGNGGTGDRYLGASGFDWAAFTHASLGAKVDLTLRAFDETPVPASTASVLARFESVQGVSGSAFSDILRGDNDDAAAIAVSGFTGSVLTNIALIDGLQPFLDGMLGEPVTSFGAGNIILGGAGSDFVEGGGGDDLIDGDAWLNVQIGVYDDLAHTNLVSRHNSMTELTARVFAGEINPGRLGIIREIRTTAIDGTPIGPDFDTAIFSDIASNYEIGTNAAGQITVSHVVDGVAGPDGTDTLSNIERLQFTDQALIVGDATNAEPDGLLTIDDVTPTEGQPLTVSALGVTDADNVSPTNPTGAITGPIAYFWQFEPRPGTGVFEDIIIATGLGDLRATGTTFTPGEAEAGLALRVRAVYQDANGVLENVFSAATVVVTNVNDVPTGAPVLDDPTPREGLVVNSAIETIADLDGLVGVTFNYQWQVGDGTTFTDIAGATNPSFTPAQAQVGQQLRLAVSFTDNNGTLETVFSTPSAVVGDSFVGSTSTTVGDNWTGTEGDDTALGNAGNDILNALGGSDTLNGGTGNDTINAGDGDDIIQVTGSAGFDAVDGGLGFDRIETTTGNTVIGLSSVVGVEEIASSFSGARILGNTTADTFNFTNVALSGISNIDGGAGNDTITGSATADVIIGNTGNDTMSGGFGDDLFRVGAGAGTDSFSGGDGNDRIEASANSATITMTGFGVGNEIEQISGTGFTNVRILGTTATANIMNFSNTTLTGIANIDSGDLNDLVTGSAGADTIIGGNGNDTLNGGGGDDTFRVGTGAGTDAFDGGEGTDRIVATANTASVTMASFGAANSIEEISANGFTGVRILGTTAINSFDFSATTLTGISNIDTGDGADTVIGSAGADTIIGGGGNDNLNGGLGDDIFRVGTGAGTDVFNGGAVGNDRIVANATNASITMASFGAANSIEEISNNNGTTSFTGVRILGTTSTTVGDVLNFSTTTLTGILNINGQAGADTIIGSSAADTILGDTGNDTLTGGTGNDVMNGGTGFDVFVFGAAGFGADTIQAGFDADAGGGGQDRLDISGLGINAGNFGASVSITVVPVSGTNLIADTLVTIGADSVFLDGVTGVGANTITMADFMLAP